MSAEQCSAALSHAMTCQWRSFKHGLFSDSMYVAETCRESSAHKRAGNPCDRIRFTQTFPIGTKTASDDNNCIDYPDRDAGLLAADLVFVHEEPAFPRGRFKVESFIRVAIEPDRAHHLVGNIMQRLLKISE